MHFVKKTVADQSH